MMLKGFSVYGLFGEYDYDVKLSDGYITFIHSLNGYGKSTVMKLISDTLNGNMDDVRDVNFQRLDLRFDDGSCLIVENNAEDLLVQIQKNELEETISVEEVRDLLSVVYIPPDRTVMSIDCELVQSVYVYLAELNEMMKEATENSGLVAVPDAGRKEYSDDELEFWCKDLKAKLDYMKQSGLEPDMPPGYRFPPSRFEIMEYRKDYEDLAFSVADYVNRYYDLAESAIIYMDIVNHIFVNKHIYLNDKNAVNVRMDSGAALPINKLSSGERQILIMFYILLFRTRPGSLVIIDEPEISMHVAWQQNLGRTLIDVARLRGLHIIAATHSPQIIHDNWDLAVELKADNDR